MQGVPAAVGKLLRRRYYLVEKARNAAIVGILVGTLGVAGYLDVVDRVRELAKRCDCRVRVRAAIGIRVTVRVSNRSMGSIEWDPGLLMRLSVCLLA